jgi:hypothetical protein
MILSTFIGFLHFTDMHYSSSNASAVNFVYKIGVVLFYTFWANTMADIRAVMLA